MDAQEISIVLGFVLTLFELAGRLGKGRSLLQAGWERTPFGRRRSASKRLQRLRPNVQLEYFREILDLVPIFKRRLRHHTELIFRHPDFYVQVLVDADDQVMFYAVTRRNNKFSPQMWPSEVHPRSHPQPHCGRLGDATFHDIAPDSVDGIKVFVRGATTPTHYIEAYYYGNPGLYQSYLAGLNECGPIDVDRALLASLLGPPLALGSFASCPGDEELDAWLASEEVIAFRQQAVPNTFGLSAPGFSPREYGPDFPLGPDPVQMRTI